MNIINISEDPITGILHTDLISDFLKDTNIVVIGIETFPITNKTFVTLEDINYIPTRERPIKRCTVHLYDFLNSVSIKDITS